MKENQKEIKIEIPEGYEIDKQQSTFEKIVFKKIVNKLPQSFEELKRINGYYVSSTSYIIKSSDAIAIDDVKNTFPTKEEAEAALALSQLCQLRDAWNEEWKADWMNGEMKYCIDIYQNKLEFDMFSSLRHVLNFKTPELRDNFAKVFKDLILQAVPLL